MARQGETLGGRYRVVERIGRGGMGTVWRADDQLLGRQVAVKEIRLDRELSEADRQAQRDRALREAQSAAQIKHRNVVVLHDVIEHDAQPCIVMELVDGRSLADVLAQDGPLPPGEAARVGAALAGALDAAHGRGVQHRDVKPGNVLLEAGTGRVVLTDFGIAQLSNSTTLTVTGEFVGSPEYTAPERMAGERGGPAADLWSLGVLLCAAVEGRSPFRRDSLAAVLHAVVFGEITLPPGLPGPLAEVVTGLLERDPQRRTTAAEARRELARCQRLEAGPGPADAVPAAPPRDSAPPPGERPPADGPAAPVPATSTAAPAASGTAPTAVTSPTGPAAEDPTALAASGAPGSRNRRRRTVPRPGRRTGRQRRP